MHAPNERSSNKVPRNSRIEHGMGCMEDGNDNGTFSFLREMLLLHIKCESLHYQLFVLALSSRALTTLAWWNYLNALLKTLNYAIVPFLILIASSCLVLSRLIFSYSSISSTHTRDRADVKTAHTMAVFVAAAVLDTRLDLLFLRW